MFSRACEYAIKIMIYAATRVEGPNRFGLKEMTEAIDSPEAFTAKILQDLVKKNLLKSYKGPTGGFELIEGKKVRLIDIVMAIDGSKLLDECVLGLPICSGTNPCPVHEKFSTIKNQLKATLAETDIHDKSLFNKTLKLK